MNESDTIEEHIPESMKEDLNEEKEQTEEEEEQQQIQDDDEEGSKEQLEEDNDYQEEAGEDEVEKSIHKLQIIFNLIMNALVFIS